MLYDPKSGGFYSPEFHGDQVPTTAVKIADDLYVRLLEQQEAGKVIVAGNNGQPIAIDPPRVVPAVVSRFQARAALLAAGLLDQIDAAVAAADDAMLKLAWAEAVEFPRTSPAIAKLAAAIGLTDEQVDQLFENAIQISA